MDAFQAVAEPTRRLIVELLAQRGSLAASVIAEQFPMSPPAISQHLKILRETEVVVMRKQAQQRVYSINEETLRGIEGWVRRMTARYDALGDVLRDEQAKQRVEEC